MPYHNSWILKCESTKNGLKCAKCVSTKWPQNNLNVTEIRHARCPTLIMMAAHSFYIPVVLVDALLQALQELFVLSALVHSSAVKHCSIIHNRREKEREKHIYKQITKREKEVAPEPCISVKLRFVKNTDTNLKVGPQYSSTASIS